MVTTDRYIDGVNSIYIEQPDYKLGHDGSDGFCDCIGMCKGGIRRAGGDASGLSGVNYAVRHTIKNVHKISSAKELSVGDVVIKGRNPGDKGYDLPDTYKNSPDKTDYYHIGTVTKTNPLEITHMTDPKPKKDTSLGKWNYAGNLPQVSGNEPEPSPEPEIETAIVYAENGKPVRIRKRKSTLSTRLAEVPCGETVEVLDYDNTAWTKVRWNGITGYMQTQFLLFEDDIPENDYTVTISGLSYEQAQALKAEYPEAEISVG